MTYKIQITKHAEKQFDNILGYMVNNLKNSQAAKHFVLEIDGLYNRMEDNPEQFPLSKESYFAAKGYREAIVPNMNYVVIYAMANDNVIVLGIFHQMENYHRKL